MKKLFLSVVCSLALTGLAFAQNEEVVYEEIVEEVPQDEATEEEVVYEEVVEEVPKKTTAPAKKASARKPGDPFFGIGLNVLGTLEGKANLNFVFKLTPEMVVTGIFNLYHHGETTVEAGSIKADQGDDYTAISIGAGFDYYLALNSLLPFSVGGELVYNSLNENDNRLDINILAGVHADIVKNLTISGKVGLAIPYYWGDGNQNTEYSRIDFGLAYKIYLTWFAF